MASLLPALKKAPRAIAEQLKSGLGPVEGVSALEIAGNGYLNVRFDRGWYGRGLLDPASSAPASGRAGKTIVEHTNINPNKAAHIGHLRNAILGDTFVRMLRATGETVEVQNYIDNTGVQVADVVVGFHFFEKKSVAEVAALITQRAFDYLCGISTPESPPTTPTIPKPASVAARHSTPSKRVRAEIPNGPSGGRCHRSVPPGHHAPLGIQYDVCRKREILHLKSGHRL